MTKKKSKKNVESIKNVSDTLKRQEDCWAKEMRINLRETDRFTAPNEEEILELHGQGVGPLSIAVRLGTKARYVLKILSKYYPEKYERSASDWNLPDQFI